MTYIMLMYLGYMLDIGSMFWWMPCILGLSIRATFLVGNILSRSKGGVDDCYVVHRLCCEMRWRNRVLLGVLLDMDYNNRLG